MRGHRWFGLPLAIVGMNSILVYCVNELIGNEAGPGNWLSRMLKIHLTAFDTAAHTSLVKILYGTGTGAPFWRHLAVLGLVWLICLWLYRRRLFVRI
jgi:predicted acyltransferase